MNDEAKNGIGTEAQKQSAGLAARPGLGSGALREALTLLPRKEYEVSGDGYVKLSDVLAALSLSSPIEPREMTDFERKEIIRLASHPHNGETVAEYMETLLPAQASSEIREALRQATETLRVYTAMIPDQRIELEIKQYD